MKNIFHDSYDLYVSNTGHYYNLEIM